MVDHRSFYFHKDHKPFSGYVNYWAFIEDHPVDKSKDESPVARTVNSQSKETKAEKFSDIEKPSTIVLTDQPIKPDAKVGGKGVKLGVKKQRWDRDKYRENHRRYMKEYRAKKKGSLNEAEELKS